MHSTQNSGNVQGVKKRTDYLTLWHPGDQIKKKMLNVLSNIMGPQTVPSELQGREKRSLFPH